MRALTIRQPWASLIACGVKTIETRSWSTGWRGTLLIHAGKAKPDGKPAYTLPSAFWVDAGLARACHAAHLATFAKMPTRRDGGACVRWDPMPLGAVVAIADLTDVVPIVGEDGDLTEHEPPCIENRPTGSVNAGLWRWPDVLDLADWPEGDCCEDVTDQLPLGDFTPGRYGWLLDNFRPLPEPVPAKGRQGLWTPDAELVESCSPSREAAKEDEA